MTAGASDRCVNIWQIDTNALDLQEAEAEKNYVNGGTGKEVFADLIDETTYEDLVDYFSYE